jgi:4-amino-4-deoxy-L-arabinose transferase-like glycosyltransferase
MKRFWNKLNFFKYVVLVVIVIRAILNAFVPLMDKTEARYAEIARIMAETNNWITPQIDYGIPFWAKPPLSTWMSALSFKFFGVNEFAARWPSLLLAIAFVFLIGKYGKRNGSSFYLPGFILLTIPEFFLHAGVVSTDTALAFCIALSMLSFWEAFRENAAWYWKYLIFVGFGFGVLAKGPIVLVLSLPPLFLWLWIYGKIKVLLKKTLLFKGLLIICVIAVPWFLSAEKSTPGFIDYFLVGEHFKRFVDSSWTGDKYGFPKSQPLGMIWVFLVGFSGTWVVLLFRKLWHWRFQLLQNKWLSFLCLWLLWTPLFFTISKSLIHPYIMPVMVPMALLISYGFQSINRKEIWIKLALVLPILAILILPIVNSLGHIAYFAPTDKYLISENHKSNQVLYSLKSKSYSSQFYSKGAVKVLSVQELTKKIEDTTESFQVLIKHKTFELMPLETRQQLRPLFKTRKKRLYQYKK